MRKRQKGHEGKPAWVLHEGRPVHVSMFASFPLGKRPSVRCPECDREVTMRLGPIRAHHFAHAEGQDCVIRRPETALHFNAKFHIAAQLETLCRTGKSLRLSARCVAGLRASRRHDLKPEDIPWHEWDMERCDQLDEREWPMVWDEVRVEHRIMSEDARRVPDVLLVQGGKPVAAVEVYATHLVDDEKARVLADLGLPWVEVAAGDILPDTASSDDGAPSDAPGARRWLASAGLPILRQSSTRPWRCANHQASYDAWRDDQRRARMELARRDAEEAERARHTLRLKALRIVDVMYPTGKHYRNIYRLEERLTDGKAHSIALMLKDRLVLSVRLGGSPKAELWSRIQDACERDIARFRSRASAVDSPMATGSEWIRGALVERVWQRIETPLRWRFGYPLADHYPMRYRRNRNTGEWFLLPDMRNVNWDRPPNDALRPHPASERVPPPRLPRVSASPNRLPSTSPPTTFGGRLSAVDLELPVEDVIENHVFRVFVVRPLDGADSPQVAVGVPLGKAMGKRIREADAILAANRMLRVWTSPPGDWSQTCGLVPWCPVSRSDSRRLVVPARTGFATLAELLQALAAGSATPEQIVSWAESARLRF